MTQLQFEKKLDSISNEELIKAAEFTLSQMCKTGGKSFIMTIPPRIDDTDILFSELIKRFKKQIK